MPRAGEPMKGPDGKMRAWQPDTKNVDLFNYLQQASGFSSLEDAQRADEESGQGSWVLTTDKEMPWWLKAFIYTGLASAGITSGGALLAPGAFGGAGAAGAAGAGGAAAGTSAAAGAGVPTSIGVGALPTSTLLAGSGPSISIGTAAAAPAAAGGGAAAGGATAGKIGTLGKLSTLGQTLTGYSQGAASGREREAILNLNADQLRQRQVESERQDQIERAKVNADLQTRLQQQQRLGHLLSQGPRTYEPPDFLKAAGSKASTGTDYSGLGKQLYDEATQRLVNGPNQLPPGVPTPPITPQPNESTFDRLMRFSGLISGGLGALSNYRAPTGRT